MPITAQYAPISSTSAGDSAPIPVTWPFAAPTDIVVKERTTATGVETVETYGVDYTVTWAANGGTVAPLRIRAVGTSWVIERSTDITQPSSLRNGGPYNPETVENVLNRSTLQIQELREEVPTFPETRNRIPGAPLVFTGGGGVGNGSTIGTGDLALRGELAGASGGTIVAFSDPVVPAYLKTVSDMLQAGEVDVLRGIPRAQWAAIIAGSSSYDASADINALLASMAARGGALVLPAGKISVASGLLLDYTGLANDEGNTRIVIRGQGSKSTEVKLTASSGAVLEVRGSWPYAQNLELSSMRLTGSVGTTRALKIQSCPAVELRNVILRGAQYGVELIDVLALEWFNSSSVFNTYGLRAYRDTLTYPNKFNFFGGSIGGNGIYGAKIEGGCLTNVNGVAFEGNGLSEAVAANAFGLYILDAGAEGRAAANISGCYFEGNKGKADVWVNQTSLEVSASFCGNTFNRLSSSIFTENNIRLETSSTGKINAVANSNGFMRAGTYTAASGRRTILGTGATRSITLDESGNTYLDYATDGPFVPGQTVEAQLVPQAYARFAWSGGVLLTQASRQVSSIVRNGTGDYSITWKHDLSGSSPCYQFSAEGEYKYTLFSESASAVRVLFTNIAGSAIDPLRVYVSVFG